MACTCIWSASPPPACTQTRLPHHPPWTVIVITSIISCWWFLLSKIILKQPAKASPVCLGCILTPVSGVLLLPIQSNQHYFSSLLEIGEKIVKKKFKFQLIVAATCGMLPKCLLQVSSDRRRRQWRRPWGGRRGWPSWRSTNQSRWPSRDTHSHPCKLSRWHGVIGKLAIWCYIILCKESSPFGADNYLRQKYSPIWWWVHTGFTGTRY